MRSITAIPCSNGADFLTSDTLVQISIGPRQELLVLSLHRQAKRDRTQQPASSEPVTYKVHRLESSEWKLVQTLPQTNKAYSFVQPLPNARWLLVAARASRFEPNANIFSEKGDLISSFHAGDGIEHVQTTLSGETWIGYFDEGIFGGGELAGSGLVCLSENGACLVRYWQHIAEPNDLAPIDDCYALNVASANEVWTAYYSDFPVVKMRNKEFDQAWVDFPSRPVKSFAVDGDRLLMVPAYRQEGSLYFVNFRNRSIEEVPVLKPSGEAIRINRSFGRGSTLFVAVHEKESIELYSVDLSMLG